MWQILGGALSVSPWIAFVVAVAVCESIEFGAHMQRRKLRKPRQAARPTPVRVRVDH